MKTNIFKGLRGWKAKSSITLNPTMVFEIETSKNVDGHIKTFASVSRIEGDYQSHTFCKDFRMTICTDQSARCTEKVVAAQHNAALARAEEFKKLANDHYGICTDASQASTELAFMA